MNWPIFDDTWKLIKIETLKWGSENTWINHFHEKVRKLSSFTSIIKFWLFHFDLFWLFISIYLVTILKLLNFKVKKLMSTSSFDRARRRFCFWLGLNFRKFGYRWVPNYQSDKKLCNICKLWPLCRKPIHRNKISKNHILCFAYTNNLLK